LVNQWLFICFGLFSLSVSFCAVDKIKEGDIVSLLDT